MSDLANTCRPKSLCDIKGSANKPGGVVDFLNLIIQKNLHSNINKFLIYGPSGTGKSTLSNLFARTTLCVNRSPGFSVPCGKCPVCTEPEVANIYSHTITSPANSRDVIRLLIEQSYRPPEVNTKSEDKYRQFIILEETQQASPELMAELLEPLEKAPDTTTWILNTMNLEKLGSRDPILAEALKSRCKELKLTKFSEAQITETLQANLPKLNIKCARAIAKFSEGNMRKAYALLSHFTLAQDISELNHNHIYEYLVGGATPLSRKAFWHSIKAKNTANIIETLNTWQNNGASDSAIAHLLEEDIYKLILRDGNNPHLLDLLSSLNRWQSSSGSAYQICSVFLPFMGLDLNLDLDDALKTQDQPEDQTESSVWSLTNYQDLLARYS